MTQQRRVHPDYSHDLLVHHDDEELVERTHSFVEQGLASGGTVVVRGATDRVNRLREVIGRHPRLQYGFNEELYAAPTRALFAYQRLLAESSDLTTYSVTGPVPLGNDAAAQGAWARYESAVNEALSPYPYRALCTYDTRTRAVSVIAAAKATHPTLSTDQTSSTNPDYVDPEAFLTGPQAQAADPPVAAPSAAATVTHPDQLAGVCDRLRRSSRKASALSQHKIDELLLAVYEVAHNGLVHGAPPVRLTLWTDPHALTCRIVDSGPGTVDPLTGYRYPDPSSHKGLWLARQLVDDLMISDAPEGGCSVLLTRT